MKEKVVLATAGSRGIGAEIARAFAAVGCKGIIGYRAGEVSANKLAAEMKAASVSITATVSLSSEVERSYLPAQTFRKGMQAALARLSNNRLG
ncbi:SDR family NAD(P)-dependent oxidoreductase [Rhizobiales bacterium TNE-4]|nr:SDR family NAD(P)-dependent oxidoreductase [Rhizobiales bacterium TNE-4]MBV1829008.1 SDR family NAD(P)-dependent oxidoreductase [Rhizobiales bacterium TNE-4]